MSVWPEVMAPDTREKCILLLLFALNNPFMNGFLLKFNWYMTISKIQIKFETEDYT